MHYSPARFSIGILVEGQHGDHLLVPASFRARVGALDLVRSTHSPCPTTLRAERRPATPANRAPRYILVSCEPAPLIHTEGSQTPLQRASTIFGTMPPGPAKPLASYDVPGLHFSALDPQHQKVYHVNIFELFGMTRAPPCLVAARLVARGLAEAGECVEVFRAGWSFAPMVEATAWMSVTRSRIWQPQLEAG